VSRSELRVVAELDLDEPAEELLAFHEEPRELPVEATVPTEDSRPRDCSAWWIRTERLSLLELEDDAISSCVCF
jgi:hypothetical protein